jgi:hypothetical protein
LMEPFNCDSPPTVEEEDDAAAHADDSVEA